MEHTQIQAFMDVIKYGNISSAARNTYTSQSYLSHKILSLEDELEIKLLNRGKGNRSTELTPYGIEFLRLVQQYQSTWNDMLSIKECTKRNHLSIGGTDSINSFTFKQLYVNHLQNHKDICLSVHTYHSRELYRKIEAREIDLAYVYNAFNYADILRTPLYNESMFLLCRSDSPYHDEMTPSELPAEQEIYMRINSEFEIWHNQFWSNNQYAILTPSGSLLAALFTEKERWTIANTSIINRLKKYTNLKVCTLKADLPTITCYQIEHKNPRPSRLNAIETFKQEVSDYITSSSIINQLL